MGIHSYSVKVGRGIKASPIAEWLECVVDELNSVACLVRAIRVSMKPDKRPRGVEIKISGSPNIPPGIQPILSYCAQNGRAIKSSRSGAKNMSNSLQFCMRETHSFRGAMIGTTFG